MSSMFKQSDGATPLSGLAPRNRFSSGVQLGQKEKSKQFPDLHLVVDFWLNLVEGFFFFPRRLSFVFFSLLEPSWTLLIFGGDATRRLD